VICRTVLKIGELIDGAYENKDFEKTKQAIVQGKNVDNEKKLDDLNCAVLNYFISNGISDLIQFKYNNKLKIGTNDKDFEESIYHLRKSINYFSRINIIDGQTIQYKVMAYTNLANQLDIVGRFVEAIEYWDIATSIYTDFGMAYGNKGLCLYNYSKLLYDHGHKAIFLKKSRELLNKAIKLPIYLYAKEIFSKKIKEIEKIIDMDYLESELTFNNSVCTDSVEEIMYNAWCKDNTLYLNPLNDILKHDVVNQDILTMPSIVAPIDEKIPKYHSFYNQIKQEYVSARFTFFESIQMEMPHYSDKNVLLYNTIDYPKYGLKIEKMKYAFRALYSLLDKIAYFINDYFDVGITERDVSFKSIWFSQKKGRNGYKYNMDLKQYMINNYNFSLQGLYWLFKDYYDRKYDIENFLEPESKDIDILRNYMEHKYLKVLEYGIIDDRVDELAYSISIREFEAKTLRLLKKMRAALIYLSLAVNQEEKFRESQRKINEDKEVMPISLQAFDDDWKF